MHEAKEIRRGNAGMTLIELVVVVLIMGTISISAFAGLTQINRMDASGAAGKITSALALARMKTLSSEAEIFLVLKYDNSKGVYCAELRKVNGTGSELLDDYEIGPKSLSIKVYTGASVKSLTTDTVEIRFRKSNASFASDYDKIVVSGLKTKTIVMVKETGRVYEE